MEKERREFQNTGAQNFDWKLVMLNGCLSIRSFSFQLETRLGIHQLKTQFTYRNLRFASHTVAFIGKLSYEATWPAASDNELSVFIVAWWREFTLPHTTCSCNADRWSVSSHFDRSISSTWSIWKMLGPFTTASHRYIVSNQVSLVARQL